VNSAGDEYCSFCFLFFEIRDDEHIDIITARRLSDRLSLANHPILHWIRYLQQHVIQHGEGIRRTMGKICSIVLLTELIAETQSIVIFFSTYFEIGFPVFDVLATSTPSVIIA